MVAGESDYYSGGVGQGAASYTEAPRPSFFSARHPRLSPPLGGTGGGMTFSFWNYHDIFALARHLVSSYN